MTDLKSKAAMLTEVFPDAGGRLLELNYVATKYAAGFFPPLLIVAFRFNVGGLLLLEPESKLARRDVLPMLGLGYFGLDAVQTAFTFGVSLTSAASTGLVFATAPVWGMLPTPRSSVGQ